VTTATPDLNLRSRPRGDTAIARVESLNHEGDGVAHIDGKAVFIHGALPGDEVRFRYHNKKKNYDTGVVQEVLTPGPARVEPRCPHFNVCGGCSLQHLSSSGQIQAKQRILLDNLARIGKVTPGAVLPPLTGSAWGYRRKARLGVRLVPKKGGVLVGFREKRSSFITDLDRCDTLDPRIGQLLPALRALVSGLSCADRVPQIEVAIGDAAIALVFRHLQPLTNDDQARLRAFGRDHGMQIHLQPGGPDTVHPLDPETPAPLTYRLPEFTVELHFGPTDFVQVNAEMNQRVVSAALALLDPGLGDDVLDLFCGLGNFTLPLARRARSVLGIEADDLLLDKARENAMRNGISNVEFTPANLYDEAELAALPWARNFDLWLLDPPRTGAIEVVKSVPEHGPRRIVYVSCYPATLARDSEVLVHAKGYRLVSAGVMDMFPQTTHVESIALFEKT
jgi:23S rRNA (uracil1939-C5)-methyltransferase